MKGKLLLSAIFLFASSAFADQTPVDQLNELLKGEISAVQTYQQALKKSDGIAGAATLKNFHDQHVSNVQALRTEIQKLGGTPANDSGAWGTWAETVVGSAKVLGDESALKALREGEQHGMKEYQEVLENANVAAPVKEMIKTSMLPKQQQHVTQLTAMIDQL